MNLAGRLLDGLTSHCAREQIPAGDWSQEPGRRSAYTGLPADRGGWGPWVGAAFDPWDDWRLASLGARDVSTVLWRVLFARLAWRSGDPGWALFTVLGKFPEAGGALRYYLGRLRRQRADLIEYK